MSNMSNDRASRMVAGLGLGAIVATAVLVAIAGHAVDQAAILAGRALDGAVSQIAPRLPLGPS